MKKLIKALVAVVIVVVVLVVALLAAHPIWVGPVVKTVAEKVGPKFTGTPIALANCSVNLYSGHIEIGGFDLANPTGCAERSAASVGSLKVDIDTLSVLSDVITVRSIEVSGVFASYVKGASGKFNFTEIGDNAKAATGSAESEQPKAEDQPEVEETVEESKPGKKVIIERLSVGDVKVAAFGVTLPLLPGTIEIKDIGKKSGGASLADAWVEVQEAVMKSSGAVGEKFATLGALGADFGKQGLDLGKKGLEAGAEGAKDALKKTGDSLKDMGKGLKGLFNK